MAYQFLKFLIAGGVAVTVNISALYVLTEFFHIYYLISAVMAFFISFGVSFMLQKAWTFKDRNYQEVHKQMSLYLVLQLVNVSLNTAFLYAFVTYLHIWYIFSQMIISLFLAIGVYFINRRFVFTFSQK